MKLDSDFSLLVSFILLGSKQIFFQYLSRGFISELPHAIAMKIYAKKLLNITSELLSLRIKFLRNIVTY